MKKALLSGILLVSLLAVPTVASAGLFEDIFGGIFNWGGTGTSVDNAPTTAPTNDVMSVLNNITNWLFAILLIVAAIAIIIAAFTFVTAQGDPEKVKTARQFVIYALIGVLVAILARGLVALVGKIGGI